MYPLLASLKRFLNHFRPIMAVDEEDFLHLLREHGCRQVRAECVVQATPALSIAPHQGGIYDYGAEYTAFGLDGRPILLRQRYACGYIVPDSGDAALRIQFRAVTMVSADACLRRLQQQLPQLQTVLNELNGRVVDETLREMRSYVRKYALHAVQPPECFTPSGYKNMSR